MPAARSLLVPGLLAFACAAWLPAAPARADCQPDPPAMGDTVTCTATDADGFSAGAVDDLDVTVEAGATVDDGAADANAITLNDANTVTIEATGAVTADGAGSHGIAAGSNNTITNQGSITVQGTGGNAIDVGDDNAVTNQGTISVGGQNGVGIRAGNDNTVTNAAGATITATADDTVGIEVGSNTQDGTADVTNSGTITIGGANARGVVTGAQNDVVNEGAIGANGAGAVAIELGDGSVLTNDGIVSVTGMGSEGVVAGAGALGTTITNDGSISVGMDGGDAIDLSASTAPANSVTNEAGSAIVGTELAIRGSGGAETIVNRGSLSGAFDPGDMIPRSVFLAGGADSLTFYTGAGTTGALDGGAGDDRLFLLGNGLGSLDLDDVLSFEQLDIGDMDNAGTWRLENSASDPFTNGVFLNNGALRVDDTTSFTGDFIAADGTTFAVLLDPVAGTNGRLDVDGNATLGMDMNLVLLQTAPIAADTTITLLTTTGTLTGTFANIPADTALLTYTLVPVGGNQLDLEILRASFSAFAATPNQEATASYLDDVLAGAPTDLDVVDLLLALDDLSAGELASAYDTLHPEAYDHHTGAMASQGRSVARLAAGPRLFCKPRRFELDPGPHREAPCGTFNAWLTVLLSDFDRDAGRDWFTSDGTSRGLLGGFDWRPDRRFLVTGWAGITAIDLDVAGVGEGDIETIELGVAAQANLAALRARAAFGYGRGNHDQMREIRAGEFRASAEAEYDSNRIHAFGELGYLLEWAGFQLEPVAGLDVSHVIEDAFEETNAGGVGLDVAKRSNTVVSTQVGAHLRYRHVQRAYSDSGPRWLQGIWTPAVSAAWRGTWAGSDRELEAGLIGAPGSASDFTVEADDSEQGVDLGGRLTFQPHGSGGSFSLWYDGYLGDAGTDHRFGGTLEVYF